MTSTVNNFLSTWEVSATSLSTHRESCHWVLSKWVLWLSPLRGRLLKFTQPGSGKNGGWGRQPWVGLMKDTDVASFIRCGTHQPRWPLACLPPRACGDKRAFGTRKPPPASFGVTLKSGQRLGAFIRVELSRGLLQHFICMDASKLKCAATLEHFQRQE